MSINEKMAKLMGWTQFLTNTDGEILAVAEETGRGNFIWHPSTDIAQAWMVIEKIVQDGTKVEIGNNYYDENDWYCQFGIEGLGEKFAYADTAPMAICLAAEKAGRRE
uniref:Phage ABA sandwich domain-containing protein n=1 Tax=viral metagenome TaxID=1070528 RepID=A0A6H1ZYF8_9ZZZZ